MTDKVILVIDTPTRCFDCPLYTSIGDEDGSVDEYGFCDDRNILNQKEAQEKIRFDEKPTWCPLKHPLKEVSNDFYIYDTEYLFKNLDREIDLLKSAERFKEYMRNREE